MQGFCMFVLSLVKKHYRLQFYMFAWTHVTLLIVVTQSHLVIQNLFEGMIWFLVPVSIVICNDIMAYLFGFFFGRTPLIKLSPKKTWEGFIGGFFGTLVFGFILAYLLAQFRYFVCPAEYNSETNRFTAECEPSDIFVMHEYTLPFAVQSILRWYLMATFTHVYIASFIRGPNPSKVLQQLLVLQPEQQLTIFYTMRDRLRDRGILPPAATDAL
ncbi:unnamed protein product [Coregonus sp. 'balchen']|nr:unnamed protein product [Coregonus sp. 'balchen']